ncbi:MAG: glycerol-3-phosphate 1-O-acyltransferase PlsY [Proteobacteria bacterium]|nr:glycerol-3-phosphate 1-O-acyltransferase PlsY [Pseudomonadota bacterium]
MLNLFLALVALFIAYLVGSFSSAIIISRLKGLEDPRNVGSGNPGATNVLRSGDKTAAILTLLGDILKGFVPVLIARLIGGGPALVALVGLAAFLGHLYPVYYQFKGGKGVATAGGVLLAISPLSVFFLICLWFIIAFITRYSSLAALIAAVAAPLLLMLVKPMLPYIALAGVIAGFLIWRHRENITRLLKGTESKIDLNSSGS